METLLIVLKVTAVSVIIGHASAQLCESCPEGFTFFPYAKKCYKPFRTQLTWGSAREICLHMNSHLVILQDYTGNEVLAQLFNSMRASCKAFWTSGKKRCGGTDFVWAPNPWVQFRVAYTNWMEGKPNIENGHESCIEVLPDAESRQVWNDESCNVANCFVCEVDI